MDIKHKWLFSVVPDFSSSDIAIPKIYLVAHCPQCQNAFTVRLGTLDTKGQVDMQNLDYPVWGCSSKDIMLPPPPDPR